MKIIVTSVLFVLCIFWLPLVTVGIIRKTKARLQGRIGASVLQPFYDFVKLWKKGETVCETVSWMFRSSVAINASAMLVLSVFVPWLSFKPVVAGDDLFLVLYLFALMRFFTILMALDPGTAFGAFGASREACLSMLVEPSLFISLAALGQSVHTSSLSAIFSFANTGHLAAVPIWFSVGVSLFLGSLVELSRMPIDDPTTHLELTMVHEAMLLENSGRNLLLAEFAHGLRLVVLYGLSVQCFLHVLVCVLPLTSLWLGVLSLGGIFLLGVLTALIESVSVKLQWKKAPEFIAYGLTMSLLAAVASLIEGVQL